MALVIMEPYEITSGVHYFETIFPIFTWNSQRVILFIYFCINIHQITAINVVIGKE